MFKKKGIAVELDKKRYLRLDLEGMVLFENLTGKPIFVRKTIENLNEKEWATLLYCSLLHEGLSDEEVTKIYGGLTMGQVNELGKKLFTAWQNSRIQK